METKILLGTRKGLLALERRNGRWRVAIEALTGAPISYAFYDDRNDTLWAGAAHGHWGTKLYRSKDRGTSWEEIACPEYPAGSEVREGVPASMEYIWSIAPGHASRPERLYLGTIPGGLFVSDNGGDTFELNDALWNEPTRMTQWFGGGFDNPGIHSIITHPSDPDRVYIGISCAGVYESRDGGGSWSTRNDGVDTALLFDPAATVGFDPHLLVMTASSPDVLWQQNHLGIYRSENSAGTWQPVSKQGEGAAHFGFAIAPDDADPMRAWVVPAQSDEERRAVGGALVVCRTDDGGNTWKELREGLPQEDCYDLTFRHALDRRGRTLAFGTTTGNLFVSENDGDTWEHATPYLPPVYSVQLAEF